MYNNNNSYSYNNPYDPYTNNVNYTSLVLHSYNESMKEVSASISAAITFITKVFR